MDAKYRYYNPAFKEKAVKLSPQNNNLFQLERDLGITPVLLHQWCAIYKKFGEGCFCGRGKTRPNRNQEIINSPKKTDTAKRKCYTSSFKEEIVIQSYQSKNISELARQNNVSPHILHSWRYIYDQFGPGCFTGKGSPRLNPEKREISDLEKKCHQAEFQLEIIKKAFPILHKGRNEIFRFIKEHEAEFPLYRICKILQVSESTYRNWKKNPISETQKRVLLLKEKIAEIFHNSKSLYGCLRITKELNQSGTKISHTQVGLYMSELGLKPKRKRRFKITTDSKHNLYTAPNVLNQQFKVTAHSMVWVSDITYIQTKKRFLYLTIIMDLYDRKIIGWSINSTLSARRTTIEAWEMAVSNRSVKDGLIFHSDRGVQYACRDFIKKLDSFKNITRSMSRRENSIDNAPAESFFNTLKRELIYPQGLKTRNKTKASVIDYIENWYNKKRIHSSLNYQTIEEFNASST